MERKMKKNSKKGFTLVELIIVIAIIAILAALLVPSMVGYIKEATQTTVIAECRQVVTAIQTVAALKYPKVNSANLLTDYLGDINRYVKVPSSAVIDGVLMVSGGLSELQYTNKGITVLYRNGEYIIAGEPDDQPPTMNGFSNMLGSSLTGEQRLAAITQNARQLVAFVNSQLQQNASSFAQGAVYWNKTQMDPSQNLNGCGLYDANGNVLASNITMTYGTAVKAEFDRLGIDAGTIRFFYDTVTVGTRNVRSFSPSYISFKSKALTGGTSGAYEYIYTPATGKLELKTP